MFPRSHFSFARVGLCARRPAKMDASSLATAAMAVAIEDSRAAAVRELMLDRERAAMLAEDRGSFLIERYYGVGRLPRNDVPGFSLEATFDIIRAVQRDALNSMRAAQDALSASIAAIDRRLSQSAGVVEAAPIRLEEELSPGVDEEDRAMEQA